MLAEIFVDGSTYSATDPPLKLLGVLRRHLDQTLHNSVSLKPNELLSLKSWLLAHAEQMSPGKALWLQETSDGESLRVVAAIGKADDGSTIVWHEPLPWPFNFDSESQKL